MRIVRSLYNNITFIVMQETTKQQTQDGVLRRLCADYSHYGSYAMWEDLL